MRAGHIYRFAPCVQVTSTGLLHACRSHLQVCSMRADHIYRFAPCVQVTSTGLLHACRSHLQVCSMRAGHIYAIGDCGGATEESRCPECNAVIGGTSHRLRDDNALAPEMDGARHAAWSEQVNLANFRLNDLL